MKRRSWAWLVLLCCLAACTGTETGNPSFQGSLGYDAYTSAPDVVALPSALHGSEADATLVQSTWLVLGEVSFIAARDCMQNAAAARAPALGAGDHAGGQAAPTDFELDAGEYCGVSLPMVVNDSVPAAAPTSLQSHSMLLQGTLADGRAFSVLSALQAQVFLHAANGFRLDDRQSGVLIGFDVASWLDALDWDQAQAEADGSVMVDANHNVDLLHGFEAHVPAGIALFRDLDRDGKLDSNPIALARGE